LFISCFEIVTKSNNVLVKFTFSIYNQQLIFTFTIPYSLYTNDDDNNGSRPPTLNRTPEFCNGIHVKKIKNNSSWNAWFDNTMIVDSIGIQHACHPFQNLF
jgi:hypothetical protein